MANKRFLSAIFAAMLVFTVTVAGIASPALNGTWLFNHSDNGTGNLMSFIDLIQEFDGNRETITLIFDNGFFTMKGRNHWGDIAGGMRGTFSVTGNEIKMQPTHFHRDTFQQVIWGGPEWLNRYGLGSAIRAEVRNTLSGGGVISGLLVAIIVNELVNVLIDALFEYGIEESFIVSGNTLRVGEAAFTREN